MTKPALKSLLVIEDDVGLQNQLRWSFENYDILVAGDRETALAEVKKHSPSVVTLDLGLPPDAANASEGFETLGAILSMAPHTKIIVVTGNDERENAVKAIGMGAYDFYQKPIDPEILRLIVDRAYELFHLEKENRTLSQQHLPSPLGGVITASPQMLKVCRTVEKLAPTDVTTLLLGESGTGKEVIAQAIYGLSPRAKKPFIAINSAAIPENLLESELFGYEKGAFTGATKQTRGKIEYANGGTFFLDEVGDLPLALQAKMLRFLQERVIERVGGREEIPVDVRVICATHRNLPELIQQSAFREDLYYRISEITIDIPALREREGDALLLARVFLDRFNQQLKKNYKGYTASAITAIENHTWPGNVRELENKVKRAVIMAEGQQITAEDLDLVINENIDDVSVDLRQVREIAERQAIQRALTLCKDNVSQAAELLGVSRPTLYDLMTRYGLKR
ncbi:MAG: PEP-CTERM-box response regulator transcription factor [Gammaproteobacteria bacterium]|nr:PEP-CTERM-box response regulator transcription factor [Gammaproteobacteria bacterium]